MEKENNGRSTTMMTNTQCVWNVEVDIFHLRCQSNSECVGEEMMLLTEWRDIWRVTEMECVQSVEADIFHLRRWPIEVSPDRKMLLLSCQVFSQNG